MAFSKCVKAVLLTAASVVSIPAPADQLKLVLDPFVQVAPRALYFPRIEIGQIASGTLVVTNADTVVKSISVWKYNVNCPPPGTYPSTCPAPPPGFGDFELSGSCSNATLLPGSSCEVHVAFRPTGYGLRSASAYISAGAATVGLTPLAGEGPPAPVPAGDTAFAWLLTLLIAVIGIDRTRRRGVLARAQ